MKSLSKKLALFFLFITLIIIYKIFSVQANEKLVSNRSWNKGAMVSTANSHATDAAIDILNKGGSATDAAIAAHLVLGLV